MDYNRSTRVTIVCLLPILSCGKVQGISIPCKKCSVHSKIINKSVLSYDLISNYLLILTLLNILNIVLLIIIGVFFLNILKKDFFDTAGRHAPREKL